MRSLGAVLLVALVAVSAGCGSGGSRKVAFSAAVYGVSRLVIADADGGGNPIVVPDAEGVDDPIWSPDGSTIAFDDSDSKSTYVSAVNVDGSHYRRLLDDQNSSVWYTWSAKSDRIVYESYPALMVVGADGRDRRKLADGGSPSWSPDGRLIAFLRGSFVHVMKDDGTGERAIAPVRADLAVSNAAPIQWSPGGRRLAYTTIAWKNPKKSCESGGDCNYVDPDTNVQLCDLHIVDVTSGSRVQVVGGGLLGKVDLQCDFAWSPDGTEVAFTRNGSLLAVSADGRHERPLTNGFSPAWSPDGKRIAFFRDGEFGRGVLYVLDLRTHHERRLARTDQVTWSPDGAELAVARTVREQVQHDDGTITTGQYVLERIDAATGKAHRIWPSAGTCECYSPPAWQPR